MTGLSQIVSQSVPSSCRRRLQNALDKRKWLGPGKRNRIGRYQAGSDHSSGLKIDNKTVSRQHLQIIVGPVRGDRSSQGQRRSQITIKCLETKFGTTINGNRVSPGDHDLVGDSHEITLGKAPFDLQIVWQPVALCFSFGSKEFKRGKDPLKEVRKRLEDTDIICSLDYLKDQTTHVVAGKRNTAKGLQALVNGKFMVYSTYVDALVYCTTPENLDEPESFCPLELEFDQQWPDALQYLPPRSKEPNERPIEDFAPNPRRSEIFEGYTFVFCDQVQFDALHAPITDGGGNALHYAVEPGITEAPDLVRYVKSVAGEKGVGEFEDGSEGKGVVIVKLIPDKDPDWAERFVKTVSLATGQRMIEQNEFLEAILLNDASILRRPLPVEDESGSRDDPHSLPQPTQLEQTQNSIKPESFPANLRERRARRAAAKKFKGFDDEIDNAPVPTPRTVGRDTQSQALASGAVTSRKYGFNDDIDEEDVEKPAANKTQPSQATQSRKRPAPEEDEQDMIDAILPAAAALKRRRIEEKEDEDRRGISVEPSVDNQIGKKVKRPKKEIDFKDVVRKRREAEEEAARQDEKSLQETMQGMNVEQMKNLAVVEEMELPDRSRQKSQGCKNGDHNDRWDDKWNGRKNFKKFRRQGQGKQVRRGQTVIVPLEEVKKKGYGIGEEYWLDSESTAKRKRKEKDRTSQIRSQQLSSSKSQRPVEIQDVPGESMIEAESSEIISVDAPRQTRHADHSGTNDSVTISQRSATNRSGLTGVSVQATATSAKRPRRAIQEQSDSDSEDDMKFRFKRRR